MGSFLVAPIARIIIVLGDIKTIHFCGNLVFISRSLSPYVKP